MTGRTHAIPSEVADFLGGGVAIVVASRDDDLRPEITRGWGPQVAAGGATVTLCVGAAPGSRTRANLEGNGAIAVTFSLPTTYRGVQLKGGVAELGEPTASQLALVQEHLLAFSAESETVGLAVGAAARLLETGLLAVTIAVDELFDQTPGSGAGIRL